MADTETGITPAMTVEEWRTTSVDRAVEIGLDHVAGLVVVRDWANLRGIGVPPTERHALAALALHGQPFGFTREDVEKLRAMPDSKDVGEGCYASIDDGPWFTSLIARIKALLPPE